MSKKRIPETGSIEKHSTLESVAENRYVDPNIESIQRIEGGGPIQKVNMSLLPKPLQYFGYAIFGIMVLSVVALLVSSELN
ncbi:hypothetical protein ACFQZE_08920 [Paenibacillus sp. GCM10027627]|uniref:hypothetical protein n=1 Tax=unclassified Paenibacillus TaxID=185978 RepID=UPI003628F389